jgi:hypothetical protein
MMRPEERESHAWCPTCRRTQPCVRNLGTTDWQSMPVYTCCICGQVTHEPVLRPHASLAHDVPLDAYAPIVPGTGASASGGTHTPHH